MSEGLGKWATFQGGDYWWREESEVPQTEMILSLETFMLNTGPSLGLELASASIPGLAGRFVLVEAQKFCFVKPSGWLSAGSHSFL